MMLDERRVIVRQHAEAAVRLVRESWDEITALESVSADNLPFDVHAYVHALATEPDDQRIPEEAIDELLGSDNLGNSVCKVCSRAFLQ